MTTITNLSGDFDTGWTGPDASGTLTLLTQAQFIAERLAAGDTNASIPDGHVDGNKIIKFVIDAGSPQARIRGVGLTAGAFSSLQNITCRMYLPPEQASLWDSVVGSAVQFFLYTGSPGSTTGQYNGTGVTYNPTGNAVRLSMGHCTYTMATQFESGNTLLNFMSQVSGTSGTPTDFEYVDFFINDAAGGDITFYLFDFVEIVDTTPKVYLRFDDGSDDHYLVAAAKLDSYSFSAMFNIYFGFLGTANYMTEAQCLEMYTKYGFNLSVHGNGDGSTWGGGASSKQVMHDEITNCRNFFNNNNLPKAFNEAVTFVGNDYYSDTTDGLVVKDLAKVREGFGVGTGHAQFGYGFSMGAISDPITTTSIITMGDGAITGYINTAQDIADLLSYVKSTGLSIICMFHVIDTSSSIGITEAEFDVILAAIDVEVQAGNVAVGDFMQDAHDAGLVTSPTILGGHRSAAGTRSAP